MYSHLWEKWIYAEFFLTPEKKKGLWSPSLWKMLLSYWIQNGLLIHRVPFSEVSSRLRADVGTSSLKQLEKVLPDLYSVCYDSQRSRMDPLCWDFEPWEVPVDVCYKLALIKRAQLSLYVITDEWLLDGLSFRNPKLRLPVKRNLARILLQTCSLQLEVCARAVTVI